MLSGWARLTDGSADITVYPGDFFYIPRGCRYQSYWYSDESIRFLSLGFRSCPGDTHHFYRLQRIDPTKKEREILAYFLDEPRAPDCLSIGMLYVLFALCTQHITEEIIDRKSDIVEKAMLYMNRNIHASAQEIAAHCGIGCATLYHAFRKMLNKTPNTVLHEIQAQRAKELLCSTDLKIEEISDRLGFSSSSYFRKIFFEQTGKTPREVRKNSHYFSPKSDK